MSDIQRWAPFDPMALMGRHPNGAFVTYADHVAAVAAAREDEGGKTIVSYDLMKQRKSYEQGQRDERDRIRRGVMWLPVVGRLAGTDSTLSALHVLAVIDGMGDKS